MLDLLMLSIILLVLLICGMTIFYFKYLKPKIHAILKSYDHFRKYFKKEVKRLS